MLITIQPDATVCRYLFTALSHSYGFQYYFNMSKQANDFNIQLPDEGRMTQM